MPLKVRAFPDWGVGADPTYWLVPVDALPDGETVSAHIRAQERPKVVALVGYHDDAEAGVIAVRLLYGYRGDGRRRSARNVQKHACPWRRVRQT